MSDDDILRGTIMVVDDTPLNLQVLGKMLGTQSHRVLAFPSGALALAAIQRTVPDLVLLDVMMPEMDGFEVCRRLKGIPKVRGVPVIFVSARADLEGKLQGLAAGGVDYITKPFSVDEVLARVQTHLKLAQLRAKLADRNEELAKSLERQRELETSRQQLIQMVVHDLKNPLAGILGNAHFLLENLDAWSGGEDMAEATTDLVCGAEKMERLTMNILDVMRFDKVGISPRLGWVDLHGLLQRSVEFHQQQAGIAGQTIQLEVQPGLAPALVDRDLFARLVDNLIDNASKYSRAGTSISIRLWRDDGVKLVVSDQGQGVPESELERIFESYYHIRETGENVRRSHGLGLAFCKLAAQAHGGSIRAENLQTGGTAFYVNLPAPEVSAVRPSAVQTRTRTSANRSSR